MSDTSQQAHDRAGSEKTLSIYDHVVAPKTVYIYGEVVGILFDVTCSTHVF